MTILALEFSSLRRSAAVWGPSGKALASSQDREQTTRAFALIEEALGQAGIERKNIDCIAVGVGPGSYTGIRVAISIAQGWHIAGGVNLLAVTTADVLAEQARRQGLTGHVTCVIDAQRQEFYVAAYDLCATAAPIAEPLHIESTAQVNERAARGEVLIGPEEGLPKNHLIFPDALVLAELAVSRTDFVHPGQLEPIYLRETTFVKAAPARFSPATP
jgi:tRNA threonylcarbamoyl adenosine modification protein YeaZ